MTRSVTLANLSVSRATTNSAPLESAAEKTGNTDTASCFAQMLDDAGSAGGKALSRDKDDQRRETHPDADTATVPVCLMTVPNTQSSETVAAPPDSERGAEAACPSPSTQAVGLLEVPSRSASLFARTGEESGDSQQSGQDIASPPAAPGTDTELITEQTIRTGLAADKAPGVDSADQAGTAIEADSSRTHEGQDHDVLATPGVEIADKTAAKAVDAGQPVETGSNVVSPSNPISPSTAAFQNRLDALGSRRAAGLDGNLAGKKEPVALKNVLTSTPLRPQQAAAGRQAVSTTVATPSITQTNGQFTTTLGKAMAGSAQGSRSDFVGSNTELTAALSKPQNEGNGVYSVTAALNPPSLGHVQAVVKVDGANVNVSIVAYSPEGHRAIAGHLDELARDLQAHGGDVQLSLSDGGNRPRQGHDTEPPVAPSENDTEETDAALPSVAVPQSADSLHVIL